jgi:uncharacterized protein YdeI (YjbR/CyaY-like superfamily)
MKNHATSRELLLRCIKTEFAGKGVTYREALDEALCFGWIDGVRRSIDQMSFGVRFTPRGTGSKWSAVNTRRARELKEEGRMHPAGLAAFTSWKGTAYSFESRERKLTPGFLRELKANPKAWNNYAARPPWYRRTTAFWVMSAVRPETRARRFHQLLQASIRGELVGPLKNLTPAVRRGSRDGPTRIR